MGQRSRRPPASWASPPPRAASGPLAARPVARPRAAGAPLAPLAERQPGVAVAVDQLVEGPAAVVHRQARPAPRGVGLLGDVGRDLRLEQLAVGVAVDGGEDALEDVPLALLPL